MADHETDGSNSLASVDAPGSASINYTYIRSQQFRVIHADGIFGGVVPNGRYVQFSFFNERAAVPDSVKHAAVINDDKTLTVGGEVQGSRTGRTGIERELETDIRMDLETARVFYLWLKSQLTDHGIEVEEKEKA